VSGAMKRKLNSSRYIFKIKIRSLSKLHKMKTFS
jgi:hypothetical protein